MLTLVAHNAAPTEIWGFCLTPDPSGCSETKLSIGDVLPGQGYRWQNGGIVVAGRNCEDWEEILLRTNL
jgi:hypothetical protein